MRWFAASRPGAVSSRLLIGDVVRPFRLKAGLQTWFWPLVLFRGFLGLLFCLSMPLNLSAADRFGSHTAAEFAKHMRELKKKLPSDDFTIVVAPPFVVIGDDEPAEVRRRAKETVQWAVEKLKAAYFDKDPADILDIWLFKDKESYEENAEKLFHSKPDTPYGYFSESDKALVMNIATGGGTLVHEIVHPFVAANFPECPAWFNEGLGSLYEQSGEKDGRIRRPHQLASARLAGGDSQEAGAVVQDALLDHDRRVLRERPGDQLRPGPIPPLLFAAARAIAEVYRRFHANCKKDPTGYATLQEILGRQDMAAFQREWEAYVLKLRFR